MIKFIRLDFYGKAISSKVSQFMDGDFVLYQEKSGEILLIALSIFQQYTSVDFFEVKHHLPEFLYISIRGVLICDIICILH